MHIKKKSLGIVVQARTGSTRLPNKVVLNFYNERSILDLILDRFSDTDLITYPKILATSTADADRVLESHALSHGFKFFCGSENDVLKRFIDVGETFGISHLVRVCADNPFINLASVKMLIDYLLASGDDIDYLSFENSKGLPTIKTHLGIFAEIVSLDALRKANERTVDSLYHEHVTNYIYEHKNDFRVVLIPAPDSVYYREDIRLTIDNKEDFELMANLYAKTISISEDIDRLITFIDVDVQNDYKKIMIDNINKYTK
jgi:spore coat polysaccharide biosynthesis protein SpsF